jgi:hypothetical protein
VRFPEVPPSRQDAHDRCSACARGEVARRRGEARVLVSDRHEFGFVHIQKTGGMCIEALLDERVPDLRQVCSRHEHLRRVPPELAAQWEHYY